MLPRTVSLIIVAIIATLSLTFLYRSTYPYVLASEEARTSVEVTEAQLAELKSATKTSDIIAFAILGATLCSLIPVVFSNAQSLGNRLQNFMVGILLGAIAGSIAGWLGHWFDSQPSMHIEDLMMHVLARHTAMLLLVAIACGVSSGIVLRSKKYIGASIVGGILGLIGSAALYGLVSGTVTTAEQRHHIMPAWDSNRALMIGSMFMLIGLGIVLQVRSVDRREKLEPGDKAK